MCDNEAEICFKKPIWNIYIVTIMYKKETGTCHIIRHVQYETKKYLSQPPFLGKIIFSKLDHSIQWLYYRNKCHHARKIYFYGNEDHLARAVNLCPNTVRRSASRLPNSQQMVPRKLRVRLLLESVPSRNVFCAQLFELEFSKALFTRQK